MTRSNGERVRLTPGNWIALCGLALLLIGALVRLESRLTAVETKIELIQGRIVTSEPAPRRGEQQLAVSESDG